MRYRSRSVSLSGLSIALGWMTVWSICAGAFAAENESSIASRSKAVAAIKDDKTGEVVLANDRIRVRFFAPGPHQFGLFPKGYTGYAVDLKSDNGWTAMATAPYFTSFCYRSGWGRDWLAYSIPQTVQLQNHKTSASVVFTDIRWDADRVRWDFTFTFSLTAESPFVDVTYSAKTSAARRLLMMWGPRLKAGEGSFESAKDEALFPGLEYLGPQERSSRNSALAPDAQLHFAPTPAKITIPLMSILCEKRMVGIMWDPMQKWLGQETCPSAVFASPNRIEGEDNHLMGLFVPSVPKFVAENGLRAHTPAHVQTGQSITISARIFAAPADHALDAITLYLKQRGGLPARPPIDVTATLETLVRALTTTAYDDQAKGWPSDFNGDAAKGPWLNQTIELLESASLVQDKELARSATTVGHEALAKHTQRPLSLALRVGNLNEGLKAAKEQAMAQLKSQNPDGSWSYVPTKDAEAGLAILHAPPDPGEIAPTGTTTQGITAGELAPLLEYVLITNDLQAWQAALKGLKDLDRYTIPYPFRQPECPPCPSLHGSYFALRCYLIAYRITGEKKYLNRAVYWAKTGLPFIYLWSLPPQRVTSGLVHCAEKLAPPGDALYVDPVRDVMLYSGLYGYGSSQFSHHWFGIPVQWIPLVYAGDIASLAEYDRSLTWKTITNGIVGSAVAQTYDKPPYTGFLPDAFCLDSWTPSGPAFSPAMVLAAILRHHFGRSLQPQTAVVRDGSERCHITSSVMSVAPKLEAGRLTFSLHDPLWSHVRAIIAGIGDHPTIALDGRLLPRVEDLEFQEECWSRGSGGLILLKAKRTQSSRQIEIRY